MNYRILSLLFCIAVALMATGCSSDDQPTGPSSSSPSESFYPTTKGSFWKYKVNGTTHTTIVSGDSTVAGQKYAVLVDKDNPAAKSLLREADGNIYMRNGEYGNNEVLYAKTNAAIGEQWSFNIMVNNLNTDYEYRMVAKGITKTVNNVEYKDVIQTHVTLYINFNGQRVPAGTAETFLAKGIGAIYMRLSNGQEMTLLEHQIK